MIIISNLQGAVGMGEREKARNRTEHAEAAE